MGQFNFVGQAYEAPMLLQDAQKCVNWYPEISQDQNSKTPIALLGTPGLLNMLTIGTGPIRGCWPLPGDMQAIVVSGNEIYMLSIVTPATLVSPPTFSAKLLPFVTYGSVSATGAVESGNATITGITQVISAVVVGSPITGAGIPDDTTVISVGAGTVTISAAPTASSNASEAISYTTTGTMNGTLVSGSDVISSITSMPPTLAVGALVSSTGITTGTTVAAIGTNTVTMSAPATATITPAEPISYESFGTFTATISSGSATLTGIQVLPAGVGETSTLSDPLGYIPVGTTAISISGNEVTMSAQAGAILQALEFTTPTGGSPSDATMLTSSGPVCIRDNATGGIAVIVDGPNGYVVNIARQEVTQITDPAWLGSDRVAFIDGWLVFNWPGTQTFYTSPLYWNGFSPMDATFFALKDSSTDKLVTFMENIRELWLVGERTTELWFDAGNQAFPFSRLQGVTPQHGCAAPQSIARVGDGIVWLGKNEKGQNTVKQTVGYQIKDVSTIAVNHAIAGYGVVNDAIAYCYQQDAHEFYVLTFPTADATWVWDSTTNMWHERLSYDPIAGLFHRHMSNCFMNFAGVTLVGDYASGNLYQMSRQAYTDNGAPLVAWRRTPHVWDKNDRERVFFSQLQIEFTPGVGLQTGQGSNPQAVLRWSDDGGQTYGNEHWKSIGLIGQTKNRAIWRRMGEARDRVFDLKFSEPVPRDIVGASLETA